MSGRAGHAIGLGAAEDGCDDERICDACEGEGEGSDRVTEGAGEPIVLLTEAGLACGVLCDCAAACVGVCACGCGW